MTPRRSPAGVSYYADASGKIQAVHRNELHRRLKSGEVDPAGHFWAPGDADWTSVGAYLARVDRAEESKETATPIGQGSSKGKLKVAATVAVAALLVIGGWLWGSGASNSADPRSDTMVEGSSSSPSLSTTAAFVDAPTVARSLNIEEALRAVVYIETDRGAGSGFIVDPKGWIVTNDHVVENARRIHVGLDGGDAEIPAELVANWPELDLAVLSIPRTDLPFLSLADPVAAEIGSEVYALGSPLGLRNSVSKGILSARRTVDDLELFQITAPVSSGSSGGPVLTSSGEVLGVTVGTLESGQNLNFAIPANYVYELLTNPDHAYVRDRAASKRPSASPGNESRRFDASGAPPIRPGPYAYRKHGSLSRTSDSFDSGHRYEVIPLTLHRNDRVQVRVSSEDFDPYLLVISPSGEVLENDDESEISRAASLVASARTGGEWLVVVTSFLAEEGGFYELRIEKS